MKHSKCLRHNRPSLSVPVMRSLSTLVFGMFLLSMPAASNAQFQQPSSVISAGATNASGGSFVNLGTVGQPIIGQPSGGSYVTGQGFWYTIQSVSAGGVLADLTVIAAGGYDGSAMRTDLQTGGFIPTAQPFNVAPWNYAGSESVGAVPANVTDWVLITLRTGNPNTPPMTNVARRAAFMMSDGSVVDLDGTSAVQFNGVAAGNYYIVVEHRNHLSVMTASNPVLNAGGTSYNFTSAQTQAFGTNPMRDLGGTFGMHGGDGTQDGMVSAFDFLNVWLPDNGSAAGYKLSDFNLDSGVTAFDFLNVWLPSNGQNTQVPAGN